MLIYVCVCVGGGGGMCADAELCVHVFDLHKHVKAIICVATITYSVIPITQVAGSRLLYSEIYKKWVLCFSRG
jgi:hypothetical protein